MFNKVEIMAVLKKANVLMSCFAIMSMWSYTVLAGPSKESSVLWTPDDANAGQKLTLSYITSMDKNGELTVTFNTKLTIFEKPSDNDKNVRICIGFRQLDSTDDFDIVQLSMRNFKKGLWETKDGMKNNVKDWCK